MEDTNFMSQLEGQGPVREPQRQYYFMAKARDYITQMKQTLGRDMTACVVTFGCQMNARDSEKTGRHFGKYRIYDD